MRFRSVFLWCRKSHPFKAFHPVLEILSKANKIVHLLIVETFYGRILAHKSFMFVEQLTTGIHPVFHVPIRGYQFSHTLWCSVIGNQCCHASSYPSLAIFDFDFRQSLWRTTHQVVYGTRSGTHPFILLQLGAKFSKLGLEALVLGFKFTIAQYQLVLGSNRALAHLLTLFKLRP